MNTDAIKRVMKFFDRYRANVREIKSEKAGIIKEAQAKIDALKIEYLKKKLNQHDSSGS